MASELRTHDHWIKHSYLMHHWHGLREALASYEVALAESTRLYHEAAPLRAQYGITISAPMIRSKIAREGRKILREHDKMEAMLAAIKLQHEPKETLK